MQFVTKKPVSTQIASTHPNIGLGCSTALLMRFLGSLDSFSAKKAICQMASDHFLVIIVPVLTD